MDEIFCAALCFTWNKLKRSVFPWVPVKSSLTKFQMWTMSVSIKNQCRECKFYSNQLLRTSLGYLVWDHRVICASHADRMCHSLYCKIHFIKQRQSLCKSWPGVSSDPTLPKAHFSLASMNAFSLKSQRFCLCISFSFFLGNISFYLS